MPRCDDLQSSLDRILKMGAGGLFGSDGVMRLDGIVDGIDSCENDTHIQFSQLISEAKLH